MKQDTSRLDKSRQHIQKIEARYSHKKTPVHARSIVRKQGLFQLVE